MSSEKTDSFLVMFSGVGQDQVLELFFDNPMEKVKPISKWNRSSYLDQSQSQKLEKKSVVFRDPLCEVKFFDKEQALEKRLYTKKFHRVKRFCFDNLHESKDDLWLPDETDEVYRNILMKDLEMRRMNRKRKKTGENLEFMMQRLEVANNCFEVVKSKMKKIN